MDYELMLLFKPLTNEDVKERLFPKLEKSVKDLEGTIKIKEAIGKRLLSYDIDSNKEGFYLLCNLTMPSKNSSKFNKVLSLMPEVLRSLKIKKDQL